MSAKPQNIDNEEIDLSQISKKINNFFEGISNSIFRGILFVQKRLIIFIALFIIGAVLGYYLDRSGRSYKSEVIVCPNFGSVDYLYAKVGLLESKLNEQDTVFFKSIGVKNPKSIAGIEIKPIIDIYNFVGSNTANVSNAQNTQNFELIKLLSEDGDINKVITDKITSKNYGRHTLIISTKAKISNKEMVDPLLSFLNQNEYFQKLHKAHISNIKEKVKHDEAVIEEVDGFLDQILKAMNDSQKSDKLVYYNENTEVSQMLQTKNGLNNELGALKVELITSQDVITKTSSVLNVINKSGLNNKMKIILPFFLIFVYLGVYLFRSFYKRQATKLSTK
ncbi:MAG: hypothetical protein M0D53_07060 [Flavobacterium sp. JAD_PAG50586_2]|nr:MAG: hypothetical protein M0D53_07060 [Flavobacterium sp. JAD_PAG50586_2]